MRKGFFLLCLGLFLVSCFKLPVEKMMELQKDLDNKNSLPSNIKLNINIDTYDVGSSSITKTNTFNYDITDDDMTKKYYSGLTLPNNTGKVDYYAPTITEGAYKNASACLVGYNRETNERIAEPVCRFTADVHDISKMIEMKVPFVDMVFYLFVGGDTLETTTFYFLLPPIKTS